MKFPLLPTMIANDVTELTPDLLKKHGIRLLMLDFDNTIVPYTSSHPTREVADWLHLMIDSDIQLCVVSNSHKHRVKIFCKAWGIPCITHARKPFSDGIRRCIEKFGIPAHECALVGDQIYTDTLGANSVGAKSILVKAINNHNVWLKMRHVAEKPFIYAAKNRRIDHDES